MNLVNVNKLAEIFNGFYCLDRQINFPSISINGYAQFDRVSDSLIYYYEEGTYFYNRTKQNFYSKRYFVFEDDSVKILNEQQIVLHNVPYVHLEPPFYSFSNTYLCGQDFYLLDFCIQDKTIQFQYTVVGPLKNYSIQTKLHKSTH